MSLANASSEPAVQKMLAALMTMHYCRLEMPLPEVVARGEDRDLAHAVSKLLSLPIKKHDLTDRFLLVPTLYPLKAKWRRKLLRVFPQKLINLTILSES